MTRLGNDLNITRYLIVKKIESALYPFHLREIFNVSVALFRHPTVHNAFFERIYFLTNQNGKLEEFEVKAFKDLKEDLEAELANKKIYMSLLDARKRGEGMAS
jgi:hypothetical protein